MLNKNYQEKEEKIGIEDNNKKGIVYILTNEAMPNLVKVGVTYTTIDQRMRELYTAGVPVPFECFHASVVENAKDVERRIHRAFAKYRINKNREFFEIPPENILDILELVEIKDVTPKKDFVETNEDKKAIKKLEKKRERFNFEMVNIPIGAELTFARDHNKKSIVVGNNKVIFNGKKMSLSKSALIALKELGYNWKSAQGAAHWMYKGKTLKEIREKIESE